MEVHKVDPKKRRSKVCSSCGIEGTAQKKHTCPLMSDVHGDDKKCNCCTSCENECRLSC